MTTFVIILLSLSSSFSFPEVNTLEPIIQYFCQLRELDLDVKDALHSQLDQRIITQPKLNWDQLFLMSRNERPTSK